MNLNILKIDLEICFAEHILHAMMKRLPVGFLYILGIQHTMGSVISFSVTLKLKRLVYSVF